MFDDNVLKTGSGEMELVDFRIFKRGTTESDVYEGIYGVNVAKVKKSNISPSKKICLGKGSFWLLKAFKSRKNARLSVFSCESLKKIASGKISIIKTS